MSTQSDRDTLNKAGQTRTGWIEHLSRIGSNHGFFDRVAPHHSALFVQESNTLVVSFDRAERAFGETRDGLPLGFAAVKRRQMSLLSIMCSGETWFRDPDLFAFFQGLGEQGFFKSFARVAFIGLGPMCGFAACAFSSAAPGASVLAASPAATVAVDRAGFDNRFRKARHKDFSSVYGYGPEALRTVGRCAIFFDPYDPESAAHAAQFQGNRVMRMPLRWYGPDTSLLFDEGDVTVPFLRALISGQLTKETVLERYREIRRSSPSYLWRLAETAQARGQFDRAAKIARHAMDATGEARFEALANSLAPTPQAAAS